MAPVANVVEDGVDERPVPGARSGWLLVTVSFGLGLILGTMIALPPGTPPPYETDASGLDLGEPVEPAEAPIPPDGGISLVVPGFPDTFVGLGQGPGTGFDYLLWPVSGQLTTRTMTGGSDVRFDVRGQLVAFSSEVPGLDGVLLWMGRPHVIRPIVTGVNSYSWHDSFPGLLAFTTEKDGEWALFAVSANLDPRLVVSGTVNGGDVAAWGDWGYAIQAEGQVVLLNSDGEHRGLTDGRVLASHESGWLLVGDDGLKLVSAGGGIRRLQTSEPLGEMSHASFSPDGAMVALGGLDDVVVVDLDNLEEIQLAAMYPSAWVTWSSDSRFVLAPARTGVLIHDVETDESHRVLAGRRIVAAATIPLPGS